MDGWRAAAAAQAGVLTRAQLAAAGVNCWAISHRIETERWQSISSTVIATTTGQLSPTQRLWAAVLHGGDGARLSGLSAAAQAGLRGWDRDAVSVAVPYRAEVPPPLAGVTYVRSRRNLASMSGGTEGVPCLQIEPAVLMFAAADRSERTAQGVLAAVIQQRLSTADRLSWWLSELKPLRRAPLLRRALAEFGGGAQSLAEADVARMCRDHRLALPERQVRRRGSDGRTRFTDCEWRLGADAVLVLEVDGQFHMDVEQWEADLARQRSLSGAGRIVVRCTARELRDTPARVARDLRALGVPAV